MEVLNTVRATASAAIVGVCVHVVDVPSMPPFWKCEQHPMHEKQEPMSNEHAPEQEPLTAIDQGFQWPAVINTVMSGNQPQRF
jgi:hypothetical protein